MLSVSIHMCHDFFRLSGGVLWLRHADILGVMVTWQRLLRGQDSFYWLAVNRYSVTGFGCSD